MIISKKKFEQEVEKRITEMMCRREQDERIREFRRDMYMELERVNQRINSLECTLHSLQENMAVRT
jgi:hypothetical protein